MDESISTYAVYALTDAEGNITDVNSSGFLSDTKGWTKIGEGTGDKYHHAQGNYFDKPIMTDGGAYRYKLTDGIPAEKKTEETDAEEKAIAESAEPTQEERIAGLEKTVSELQTKQTAIETDLTEFKIAK